MLLCRISCELAGCVHQPIVGSGQTNLSHLYFSRLSLALLAKLNFFKTPTSVRLVQVGPCPLPLEYQAATSHTGRQPCRVKSLYMKRFWRQHIYEDLNESSSARPGGSQQLEISPCLNSKRAASFFQSRWFFTRRGDFNARQDSIVRPFLCKAPLFCKSA